jgi:hypothetical protein
MAVCTKLPYPNAFQAGCAMSEITRRAVAGSKVPRSVYRCGECAALHLSSKQPSGRVSRRATGLAGATKWTNHT